MIQWCFYEKDCFDANSLGRIKSTYTWSLKFSQKYTADYLLSSNMQELAPLERADLFICLE